MQAWVQKLHASNRSWVPIVDPGIKVDPSYKPYTDGLAADIFVKDAAGKPYLGKVQSKHAKGFSRCFAMAASIVCQSYQVNKCTTR